MAKQLQLRRGTTAQHSTFTGAVGEVTIDTDKDVIVVHDGTTAGGEPMLSESAFNSSIGSTVQAYDADTTKNDVANTFTKPQRGQITTDNDLLIDLNQGNNFNASLSAGATLSFVGLSSGQSGNIILGNSGGHIISLASNVYMSANDLSAINSGGLYWLSYITEGTAVLVTASEMLTAQGL